MIDLEVDLVEVEQDYDDMLTFYFHTRACRTKQPNFQYCQKSVIDRTTKLDFEEFWCFLIYFLVDL